MRPFRSIPNRPAQTVLFALALFFLFIEVGYTMQPPPPPLNLEQLKMLISSADAIGVVTIDEVKKSETVVGQETRRTVEAVLFVEKLIKGDIQGKNIVIKETYPVLNPSLPAAVPQGENKPGQTIIGRKAGPSCYHGEYSQGGRMVVLLEKIEGRNEYKPLGSGSYNKYLGEFVIETGSVKSLYYQFADDLHRFTKSENQFVDLISRLADSASRGRDRCEEYGEPSIRV